MATLEGMVWFISSSVSMIRPLKFFMKIISASISWIMTRKRKIYFMMSQEVNNSVQSSYWENLSADYFIGWVDCYELFSLCEQHLLCYENWILRFWSRWSVQKKQTCSKSDCFFFGLIMCSYYLKIGYLMLCFYSTGVPLNVFRMSSSWLSL